MESHTKYIHDGAGGGGALRVVAPRVVAKGQVLEPGLTSVATGMLILVLALLLVLVMNISISCSIVTLTMV